MKKRKLKTKNVILILLILVFVFSISKLVLFAIDLYKNNKNSKDLIEKVVKIEFDEETKEEITKIDFNSLLSINKDIIGWIKFNQDKVNYPILHSSNKEYYLYKSYDKTYNQAGSIFMDYRNISIDDKNVVLFGHSMLDGSMFGSLKDIFKEDFFDTKENNYIQIINPDNEILTYQIFSYYIIEKEEYYITTSFSNDYDFQKFIDTLISRSYKDFDTTVTTQDKILTLSTCYGTGGTTKRKVIHAKRIV